MKILPKGPRSIFPRIALSLLCVVIFSCVTSFAIAMPVISQSIVPTIKTHLTTAAKAITRMSKNDDTSTNDIISYITNSTTKATYYSSIENLPNIITASERERLQNGEYIFKPMFNGMDSYLVMRVRDGYIRLNMTFDEIGFAGYRNAALLTLFLCLLISASIITIYIRRFTNPLTQLSKATKEIAKGNFDVNVSVDRESYDQTEMSQLISNFNKMAIELSKLEFMRKDFVNSVSHEFKTPIASIQGFATMLRDKSLTDDEREEFTNIIISESKRLSNLSTNILRIAKLDSQEFVDKTKSFSLSEQLRTCILILEPEWSAKEIDLDVDLDEVDINGDEELLTQAWINLISNAIKFTDSEGKITVSLKKTDKITVTVEDSGIGMSEETQKRIFEMFYQGDKEHSSEGNGLGLAIVKRIIDLSGGKIEVQSELGKGSRFVVTF